ncbi:NAD(P)/FAD-dependent oxidoreductase [Bacillus sp. H-16]|uniref:NAD(P)/FAD-dependent oxidoreductase n=1 Tax=Alteribacter salitolerans TaxID=2912333 RepID=UPI001965BEBE|nr:NAD(P)/FAD-dependent oxidoreductase [Alteribacter salitolerans]MBM7096447.1 NAD(P)/FAD-dependent oxidoreductase [Alteribacter salitolerans]
MMNVDVVIVGGGPAGVAASIWCKRLELSSVLLESNSRIGGQLSHIHNRIIDYPGIVAENGKELQKHFEDHLAMVKSEVKTGCEAVSVDCGDKTVSFVRNDGKETVSYTFLILATGSRPRSLNVPGEKEMLERNEVYSAVRDKGRLANKVVAIAGGGDRAFEGADILSELSRKVYLIHRSDRFKARKALQDRVLNRENIEVLTHSTVTAVLGDRQVEQIRVNCQGEELSLSVEALLIRIGVEPVSSLVKGQVDMDENGCIQSDQMGQTSDPYVYAIGDLVNDPKYSSLSVSGAQGMMTVKHINERLNTNTGPVYY